MRRFWLSAALSVLALSIAPQPASAAPRLKSPSSSASGRSELADRNSNRISDAFQPSLDAAASNDRFDVVVTYSGAGSAATAQQEVGSFYVSHQYRIVHGFSATMTATQ